MIPATNALGQYLTRIRRRIPNNTPPRIRAAQVSPMMQWEEEPNRPGMLVYQP